MFDVWSLSQPSLQQSELTEVAVDGAAGGVHHAIEVEEEKSSAHAAGPSGACANSPCVTNRLASMASWMSARTCSAARAFPIATKCFQAASTRAEKLSSTLWLWLCVVGTADTEAPAGGGVMFIGARQAGIKARTELNEQCPEGR